MGGVFQEGASYARLQFIFWSPQLETVQGLGLPLPEPPKYVEL